MNAYWVVALGLFVIVGGAFLRLLERRRQAVHKAEEDRMLEVEIASGRRLPDGRLACRVCHHAPASEPLPAVKVSRMDRHPLRELHALGPMYEVAENGSGEREACGPCRRMVLKRLASVLAEKRAERAVYNANEAQAISRAELGALRWAQEQYDANARQIGAVLDDTIALQLPPSMRLPSTGGVIEVSGDSLPPSGSSISEDEQS